MLSTIQQLIDGRSQPTTVSLNDTVQRALELMIENDKRLYLTLIE